MEPQATDTGATNDRRYWSHERQEILEPRTTGDTGATGGTTPDTGAMNDNRYRSHNKQVTGDTGAMNDTRYYWMSHKQQRILEQQATNRYWWSHERQQILEP